MELAYIIMVYSSLIPINTLYLKEKANELIVMNAYLKMSILFRRIQTLLQ